MPTYDRIKLEITDISPESASKVFQFLHHCLENNDLTVTYFKKNINDYTIGEKYFIFYYSKQYFSSSHRSYLTKWLANKETQLKGGGQNEHLLDYLSKLSIQTQEILSYISINEKTIERQFKALKKKNLNINANSKDVNYKIPLYLKFKNQQRKAVIEESADIEIDKDVFKEYAKNLFHGLIEGREFEDFFNNSFDYKGNIYPVNQLNIEFENSREIYSKFYSLYKFYYENKNRQNKIINEYYQGLLDKEKAKMTNTIDKTKDVNEDAKKFRTQYVANLKAPLIENVGRFEFMKIMYNSFPQIRESYLIYKQKNPSTKIDPYLKTKSRNIK